MLHQAEDMAYAKSEHLLADIDERIKLFQNNEDICARHRPEIWSLLRSKIFKVNQVEHGSESGHQIKVGDTYSIKRLLRRTELELDRIYFTTTEQRSDGIINSSGQLEDQKYYKIKVNKFKSGQSMAAVVMIQDHTSQVNFYQTKRRKELMQMVNACVSHEMKNPINSIQGYNLKQ